MSDQDMLLGIARNFDMRNGIRKRVGSRQVTRHCSEFRHEKWCKETMSDQGKLLGIARNLDMKNGVRKRCRIKASYSTLFGI